MDGPDVEPPASAQDVLGRNDWSQLSWSGLAFHEPLLERAFERERHAALTARDDSTIYLHTAVLPVLLTSCLLGSGACSARDWALAVLRALPWAARMALPAAAYEAHRRWLMLWPRAVHLAALSAHVGAWPAKLADACMELTLGVAGVAFLAPTLWRDHAAAQVLTTAVVAGLARHGGAGGGMCGLLAEPVTDPLSQRVLQSLQRVARLMSRANWLLLQRPAQLVRWSTRLCSPTLLFITVAASLPGGLALYTAELRARVAFLKARGLPSPSLVRYELVQPLRMALVLIGMAAAWRAVTFAALWRVSELGAR